MHPSIATLTLRLAAPAAALVAALTLAAAAADAGQPGAAATAYVGLAASVVLLAAGALDGRAGAAGALTATAALWALPAGPARGAVTIALAGAALAAAAVIAGAVRRTEEPLPASFVVPLALGLQGLFAGPGLLAPPATSGGAATLVVTFALLPLVAAAAVLLLARRHGAKRALVSGALVVAVAGGTTPAAAIALVALAAAGEAGDRARPALWRLSAAGAMLAPLLLGQRIGGVAVAAAATVALAGAARGRRAAAPAAPKPRNELADRSNRWVAVAPAAGVAAIATVLPHAALEPAAAGAVAAAALVPLVVPAALFAPASRRSWGVAALLLGWAAAVGTPGGVAGAGAPFAAPVALAALALPRPGHREGSGGRQRLVGRARTAATAAQATYAGWLLGVAALAAAYPWLRPRPLEAPLELLGGSVSWKSASVAVVAMLAATLASVAHAGLRRPEAPGVGPRPATAELATAAVLILAVAAGLPAAGNAVLGTSRVLLDARAPAWSAWLDPSVTDDDAGVRRAVVDSSLANAADLPAGTPVATLELFGRRGERRSWVLRAGEATGEWAAAREGRPLPLPTGAPAAPDAWLSWVDPEEGFFGRRYRARREWPTPLAVERVEVRRRPDLPAGVTLTLFRVELGR